MRFDASDITDLRPIIAAVVEETIASVLARSARFGDRVGFTEPEAAELIGLPRHVLRDCRLRGEITARKCGKKYVYERGSLVRFLLKENR